NGQLDTPRHLEFLLDSIELLVPLQGLTRRNVAQCREECNKAIGLDLRIQVEGSRHVVPQCERDKDKQAAPDHYKVAVAIAIEQRLDDQQQQRGNHDHVVDLAVPGGRAKSECGERQGTEKNSHRIADDFPLPMKKAGGIEK